MKYLVIHSTDDFKSAFAFESYNDAVDYINECSDRADDYLNEMKSEGDDSYRMALQNGSVIKVKIVEQPDSKVRYDVSLVKNNQHIETRRYTKRKLAVDHAVKILDDLGCYPDFGENEYGEWNVDIPGRGLKVELLLNLVLIEERDGTDYSILGLSNNATLEDVKKAYRSMALKCHPDRGGDPKKFQEIHSAYENIISGRASGRRPAKVSESYLNIDMRHFFDNFDELQYGAGQQAEEVLQSVYSEIRSKALGLVVRGIVEASIGLAITYASYNAAQPGDSYIIFYGLVAYGAYDFFRGLYCIANPKALLNKTKK